MASRNLWSWDILGMCGMCKKCDGSYWFIFLYSLYTYKSYKQHRFFSQIFGCARQFLRCKTLHHYLALKLRSVSSCRATTFYEHQHMKMGYSPESSVSEEKTMIHQHRSLDFGSYSFRQTHWINEQDGSVNWKSYLRSLIFCHSGCPLAPLRSVVRSHVSHW